MVGRIDANLTDGGSIIGFHPARPRFGAGFLAPFSRTLIGILAVVAVMSLSGCELDADVELVLDRNGAGRLHVVLAMDDELAAEAEEAGLDPFAPVLAAAERDGRWETTQTESGVSLNTTFDDPDELERRSGALAAGLDAAELSPLHPIAVRVADGRVTVEGSAGLTVTPAVAELGFAPEQAHALLARSVTYTVQFEMPGEVIDASAGAHVDGSSVTWTIPAGAQVPLRVVAERPPLLPWPIVAVAALVMLGILVGGVVGFRRRSRRRRRPRP